MMNNATYIALCVAQMAMDGNSAATIEFFRKIAPTLMSSGMINGVQAAELTYMTPQGAGKHIKHMTAKTYLVRRNRRRWEMSDRFVKHKDLIPLTRFLYSDN